MTDLEFKQQVLDTKSSSFCAAKWYNATIWLGSGMTTSCHHPPAHLVNIDKVRANPRLLHNTDQKKEDRRKMIAGERPGGCEYCWKIEDMGSDAVSDRVYKSKIYPIEALNEAFETPADADVNLRTLEIAFDRTCQFACSYCNPAFSSTWVRDIRNLGTAVDLDRLLDSINGLEIDLYTSNESVGLQAEYIRDGLVWDDWTNNVERLLDSRKFRTIHIMNTINALCLYSLDQFLECIMNWKREHGRDAVSFTLNILRFPSFQSPLVLPDELRTVFRQRLEVWLDAWWDSEFLHEHEVNHVQRLIDYLDIVKTPHSEAFDRPRLLNDFKQFYTQYDQRRGKCFDLTFPALKPWYDSL